MFGQFLYVDCQGVCFVAGLGCCRLVEETGRYDQWKWGMDDVFSFKLYLVKFVTFDLLLSILGDGADIGETLFGLC